MSPSIDASLGTVLADRYEVVRLIARGGMGDVYEARDRLLRRQVAVKVYRASALADRSRFDAEVHTLAALNHPGLVQVYDVGEHDGDGYIVLELVDGPTLRSILAERGPLGAREVGEIGTAVASALAYVHKAGVVHRDVTPSNILCGVDGRPRLADFGIARLLDTTRVTAVATTIGTAAYMAPEQVEGRDVTPAADVYALGLVLAEALTGRAAFDGVGHEVALARLARDPDVETDVPASWHPLLTEMTSRDPGLRPTADGVSARLATLAAADVAAVPTGGVLASKVVGTAAVDGEAMTEAMATGGGTTVMPVVSSEVPVAPVGYAFGRAAGAAIGRTRRVVWVLAALLVMGALAAVASAGGDGGGMSTTTTPTVVTVPVMAPTTTAPSTTTRPPRDGKGKGHDGD